MSFKVGDRVEVNRNGFTEGEGTVVKVWDSPDPFPYAVALDARKAKGNLRLARCAEHEVTPARSPKVGDRVRVRRNRDEGLGTIVQILDCNEDFPYAVELDERKACGDTLLARCNATEFALVKGAVEDAEPSEVGFVTELARAFRDFATRLEGIVKDYE